MSASLNSVFAFVSVILVLFHKPILRRLGFNSERARDKFVILSAAFFIFIATYLGAQSPLPYHMTFFLGGLSVAIPAGILTRKHRFKNIKDNVLYPRKGLAFYLPILAGAVVGGVAAYLGFLKEFVSFAAGWTTMSLGLLVFFTVRYEKKLGPLMLD
jgi:predicted MFS family arabinose efflux permease